MENMQRMVRTLQNTRFADALSGLVIVGIVSLGLWLGSHIWTLQLSRQKETVSVRFTGRVAGEQDLVERVPSEDRPDRKIVRITFERRERLFTSRARRRYRRCHCR